MPAEEERIATLAFQYVSALCDCERRIAHSAAMGRRISRSRAKASIPSAAGLREDNVSQIDFHWALLCERCDDLAATEDPHSTGLRYSDRDYV